MGELWGMDVEHGDEHAERMGSAAETLTGLGDRLRVLAIGVAWHGPDAELFRQEATAVIDRLGGWGDRCRVEATVLRDHADEQTEASAADVGSRSLLDLLASATEDLLDGMNQGTGIGLDLPSSSMSATASLLGEGLGTYDDLDDDIAEIERDDLSRPDGEDLRPTSMEDIAKNLKAMGGAQTSDATSVRVQEVVGDDGVPRYIVYVPGSFGDPANTMNPQDTDGNPMDWNQNPGALLGAETDSSQAVQAAMEAAGVPHGADVVIAGHSQGGMVATNLAADPEFNGGESGYHVTDVVTFGSPVEHKVTPEGTNTINFANRGNGLVGEDFHPGDPIPLLDEPFKEQAPVMIPSDHREVALEAPDGGDAMVNHGIGKYVDSIEDPSSQGEKDIKDFVESGSLKEIFADGAEEKDTVDVPISRDPSTY